MNAIVKLNEVSGESLAALLAVIEGKANKTQSRQKIRSLEQEPEEISFNSFRFAKVVEVKPDGKNNLSYLVTLKIYLHVQMGDGGGWCEKDLLVSVFRSLGPRILPVSDKGKQLNEMMSNLLSLKGKSLPQEICESEEGGGRVIVEANTPLTTEILLQKVFPRLAFVELHGFKQEGDLTERNEGALQLFRARDIAASLS